MHLEEACSTSTPGTVFTEETQMQMEMNSRPSSDSRHMDDALDRLRRDLLETPEAAPDVMDEDDEPDIIDYASVEFEVERMRKRLGIWEIFMTYMRNGARSWSQVQQALTPEDFEKIMVICDGVPLRDLLLDLR
jgi:hypothetical protein